jgi:hypothetical protein
MKSAELMPYSRRALLFGIQKTVVGEYGNVLLLSKQSLNKDVEALIHSGHDETNLYMQFRIGEREGPQISPEALMQLATDCKSKLENLYNRTISIVGYLRRCTDDAERIEL